MTALLLPLSSVAMAIMAKDHSLLPDGVDTLLLMLAILPPATYAVCALHAALRRAALRCVLLYRFALSVVCTTCRTCYATIRASPRTFLLLALLYSLGPATAAGPDESSSSAVARPNFDGTRPGYIMFRIGLAGWLAWKDPEVAVHAAKSSASAPGASAPADVMEKWDKHNIKLYGAIIACVPDWLKTTLFIGAANDGLKALAHLEKEYGSSDPNDRAAAVSRATSKYIDPKAALSEDDLRYQFDQMQLANADIIASGGTPIDDELLKTFFDNALPKPYHHIRQMVRDKAHTTLAAHYAAYMAQVKAELQANAGDHVPNAFAAGRGKGSKGGKGKGGKGGRGNGSNDSQPHTGGSNPCFRCGDTDHTRLACNNLGRLGVERLVARDKVVPEVRRVDVRVCTF